MKTVRKNRDCQTLHERFLGSVALVKHSDVTHMCTAQEEITSILDECLMTDAELAAGQAVWDTWSCPWDTL